MNRRNMIGFLSLLGLAAAATAMANFGVSGTKAGAGPGECCGSGCCGGCCPPTVCEGQTCEEAPADNKADAPNA